MLVIDSNPKTAADEVLAGLRSISPSRIKGAHDADLFLHAGKAYIVYEANDVQPGEDARWPFVYCELTIVDLETMAVEKSLPFAAGGKSFTNVTLPPGACFVPRILPKDERTLRLFFASEEPGVRQSQTWWLDFDLVAGGDDRHFYPANLETSRGKFSMQPQHFYDQALAEGFSFAPLDFGLYLVDSFKRFDGRWYAVVNNFPIGQSAWAEVNEAMDGFRILGNMIQPATDKLSEASVTQLPDSSWLAIARCSNGDHNYRILRSPDGCVWSQAEHSPYISNGGPSKPTLDCFGGVYYSGWQEATRLDGYERSVFNVDISRDGWSWARKYRFETKKSFQYPVFREHGGIIYVAVTTGGDSFSAEESGIKNKQQMLFGPVEIVCSSF